MNWLDIVLVIVFIAVCAWAVYRRFVRQLLTLGVLYLSTLVAGSFYVMVTRFFKAIIDENSPLWQTFFFWLVFLFVAIALEAILRKSFPDVRLINLGFLDNLLGLLPGVLCALIICSLLYTALGFAFEVEAVAMHPVLSGFLRLYMVLHVIWMPTPPPLLAYVLA